MRFDKAAGAILAVVAVGAAACGGGHSNDTEATPTIPARATVAATMTPAPSATVADSIRPSTFGPKTSTPAPAGSGMSVPTATASLAAEPPTPAPPQPTAETIASPDTVTLDDDGALVTMHVGDRFVLSLGDDVYDWNVEVSDQTVVGRVVNITVVRGAQGVYEARAAGRITLTATGDPQCRNATPACALPSRVFHIDVVVS